MFGVCIVIIFCYRSTVFEKIEFITVLEFCPVISEKLICLIEILNRPSFFFELTE